MSKKLWPNQIHAIIFDNDGTLMDTEWVYSVAHKECTGQELNWDLKTQLMGRTAIESCRITCKTLGLTESPESLLARREAIVNKFWPTIPLMPGVDNFVHELKNRHIPMAIATASNRPTFDLKSSGHRDVVNMMDHTTTGDEVKAGKPAPDLFLGALHKWNGICPCNALVFEDSPLGILAANRAGMPAVFIPDSHLDAEQALTKAGATPVLTLKSMADFDFSLFEWPQQQ